MAEPTNEKLDTVLFVAEGSLHLMDPNTFEQEEVPAELFGSGAAYLAPDASVTLLFGTDGKALSGGQAIACSQARRQCPCAVFMRVYVIAACGPLCSESTKLANGN